MGSQVRPSAISQGGLKLGRRVALRVPREATTPPSSSSGAMASSARLAEPNRRAVRDPSLMAAHPHDTCGRRWAHPGSFRALHRIRNSQRTLEGWRREAARETIAAARDDTMSTREAIRPGSNVWPFGVKGAFITVDREVGQTQADTVGQKAC